MTITTSDLSRAREFWVSKLGLPVTEEQAGHFFVVDAGGLPLCVDLPDGNIHKAGGADPILGLKVSTLEPVLAKFQPAAYGRTGESPPASGVGSP